MQGLGRLLRPESVAVIGGGTWCASVVRQCRAFGFDGPIWPVHPVRDEVAGLAACRSVADLPGTPDAAFIGVNREATVEVVAALAARGAGGAVCFASGFREAEAEMTGGVDLQERLVAAAGGMRLLGPNCYGLVNALDGVALWPDVHGLSRCDRGVAIVTQSSNLSINLTMQTRGLPIAAMVTAGNQAQTRMAEIAAALLEDPRVTALGLHIEGIGDLPGFVAMAERARALGKPVVALKIGASDQARTASVSHTASIAGSDAGARALFARLGIGVARSPAVFLETLKLLHVTGGLGSGRIASMSCSGGEASLMADLATAQGLALPLLSAAQIDGLREALGPRVALANPLDYHTYIWGDTQATADCFAAMMRGDVGLGCVVLDIPRPDRFPAPEWHQVIDAVGIAQTRSAAPIAVIASLPETMPEEVARSCVARGILPLCGMEDGLAAIAAAAAMAGAPKDRPVLMPGAPIGQTLLSEADAKAALAACGVPVPRSARAACPDAAVQAAAGIGFPVVLKGEGVAHKTEAGAVVLDLASPEALRAAATTMAAGAFLVEEMVAGAVAELLIGVLRDPAHGFVLTLAAGGVLAELMDDAVTLLLPVTRDAARAALHQLRVSAVLRGYRGAATADEAAILDAIEAVQAYVIANRDRILEVEINPLICCAGRAVAADALIRIGESQ